MVRVELKEQEVEQVVGGHFNWYREDDGTRMCYVTDIGHFVATAEAKDTFAWLKMEHRGQGWTDGDYVNALISAGVFTPA